MMISPEMFIDECRKCSYVQLIEKRDELLEEIENFEASERGGLRNADEWCTHPSPSLVYCMNMECLSELLKFMQKKYNENDLIIDETDDAEKLNFIKNVIWNNNEYIEGKPNYRVRQAEKFLNKLIENGNADAINLKGARYYEGQGVEQNQKKALQLYKKAADAGCALAMSNLAFIYYYGNGTTANMEKAYLYCSMAVQRDEWDAINLLGDMYREGVYVPKDEGMAFNLYNRCYREAHHNATNDAYPACLVRMAELLYKGDVITTNHIKAYELLKEAESILKIQIENGNYYAKMAIERVNKDIKEVEKMQKEANLISAAFLTSGN